MALGMSVASDISRAILDYYVRGKAFSQTTQDKPLWRIMNSKKKTFPGGAGNIRLNVQGDYMSDGGTLLQGFTEDEQLTFAQAANIKQVYYPWYEMHAGMWITETELKKNGISIVDDQQVSRHTEMDLTRITDLLENRLDDFGESYSRAMQLALWKDGSQDAQVIKGLTSILTDTPNQGTTGGLSRADNVWWRHRVKLDLAVSESEQTLTKYLRAELRQLRRFGGRPDTAVCGSAFIAALESEFQAKGSYTIEGFTNEGRNDLGMAKIKLMGLGTFEYDPTLDDLNMSKRCYVFDSSKIQLRPMEGEDTKQRNPTRPYDYLVFLNSITYTGTLVCTQLNCNGVYAIA